MRTDSAFTSNQCIAIWVDARPVEAEVATRPRDLINDVFQPR